MDEEFGRQTPPTSSPAGPGVRVSAAAQGLGPGRREQLGLQGLRVERARQQESLNLVDILVAKMIDLAHRFDAFSQGDEAKVLAELHVGADERVGFW